MYDTHETGMIALPCGEKNYNNILSRFHGVLEATDGRRGGVT